MVENKKLFITRDTQHRLIKDIRDIVRNPLLDQGIMYIHDEDDMLKGYSMIIGPPDTIYADGFYLFEWSFPYNYPFSPPILKFLTSDGITRFHPNLYRNGKVCLSLLNTWKGEQWTSCQTIRSILITLITLFHNKPLLNEPGFMETHYDFKPYNTLIKYANYKSAIFGIVSERLLPTNFITFYTFIKKHFLKEYDNIIKRLEAEAKAMHGTKALPVIVRVYNLRVSPDYKTLCADFKGLHNLLINKLK